MMNTEKRLILAVALSAIIIIAYQGYMGQFSKPYHASNIDDTVVRGQDIKQMTTDSVLPPHVPSHGLTVSPTSTVSYDAVVIGNNAMHISTTNYKATINELLLLDYNEEDNQPYPLVAEGVDRPLLLETVFLRTSMPDMWRLVSRTEHAVQYKNSADGLDIIKTITADRAGHVISMDLVITNTSGTHKTAQYIINNGHLEVARGHMDSRYLGVDAFIEDKVMRKRASSKTMQEGESLHGAPRWIATRGRYFSFLMKPEQEMQSVFIKSIGKNDLYAGLVSTPIVLVPQASARHTFTVYAGPNNVDAMMEIDVTAKEIINYGIFHGIGRLLFNGLQMFYGWTSNYGVAIIVLSLIISLVMLPLTRKSLHSMKEMQKIQPETELIRKQYGSNPQKMNKEIMELYKKHKINPVGGCLPMLLQIPIFFSLYQVLLRSVELKGAPFLWIKDLAEPDAAFALPGAMRNLPFLGGHVNILPILMAVAMAFQQRLSQGGGKKMSEQQRLMAGIMPIMFGLIFYNMPSGLVLYWFTNTLFMLVIQEVVLKSRAVGQVV
jgi:YidC/Oxa1 family membrane protein insertase